MEISALERHPSPARFLEMDLLSVTMENRHAFQEMVCQGRNMQVVVADPPWESTFLATNHSQDTYKLIDSRRLLDIFTAIKTWFVPTEKERVGELYLFFTNDKFQLALDCLNMAGYTLVGMNSWHKATKDKRPMAISPYRGNVEMFLVGRKSWKNESLTFKTSRGFVAPPHTAAHSSKPLEFYTEFLPTLAQHRGMFDKPWSQVAKCDLFTRHAQEGFVSIGNEYHGPRTHVLKTMSNISEAVTDLVSVSISESERNGKKRTRPQVKIITESFKRRTKTTRFIVDQDVTVLGPRKVQWKATVLETEKEKLLVKWKTPKPGWAKQEWVSQDMILSELK